MITAFSTKLDELVIKTNIDLSALLNVPQTTVDEWLDGVSIPTLLQLYLMANAFNLIGSDRLVFYELAVLSIPLNNDPMPQPTPTTSYILIDPNHIKTLPTNGVAWDNVFAAAQLNTDNPNLSDQNDKTDTNLLAKALVWVRTNENKYRDEVIVGIKNAIGTETGAGILAIVRNIQSIVVAADLISLDEPFKNEFTIWLSNLRHQVFSGAGPSLSIISCHEKRPNNFGTHAGATRMLIDRYTKNDTDLTQAINVFKGWLGDRNIYADFSYGDLSWQCDPNNPVGINPMGCTKEGYIIDGVLPDDQRRAGGFTWPPPHEGYVWEGIQGVVIQAEVLKAIGLEPYLWSNSAIFRAIEWLYEVANYPAEGDDAWITYIINYRYNTEFSTTTVTSAGKGFGYADWLYG